MSNANDLERIKQGQQQWEEGTLGKALSRFGERREVFTSISGTPIDRLYTPNHSADEAPAPWTNTTGGENGSRAFPTCRNQMVSEG